MAEEDLVRALDKFGQIENEFSANVLGTGLGLPLTKGLVESHGGVLEIQSKLGKGTTVNISLPKERVVQQN
ncbi:MAG: ATP-binding protein [Rhodospirillales bacterium]|jgi:signal transduction histidine kinase|nr:ATP-binding protein [Rhodospirillales bacterium]